MHTNQACFQIPRDIPFQFQSMNFGKIFLSSGVAFFMAILVAILIETFGGAVGSVIGTLPSTVIPAAYIFITERTKTIDERVESVMSCLYGMVPTDLLFLPSWRIIPPKLPKKPSETDPNDTAVLNQDSIIPTEANINPEGEKVDGESLQEEKVEMPSQVVLPNEVAASVNLEGSA